MVARSDRQGVTIARGTLCLDVPRGVFFLDLTDDESNNEPLSLVDLPSGDDEDEERRIEESLTAVHTFVAVCNSLLQRR
jgi:hypothetical protein